MIGNTTIAEAYFDPLILLRGNSTVGVKAKVDLDTLTTLISNSAQVAGSELPYFDQGWAVITLQGAGFIQDGFAWQYWVNGAQNIVLPLGIDIKDTNFDGLVSNILARLLSGSPLVKSNGSVESIDVTAINKFLANLTIVDATTL